MTATDAATRAHVQVDPNLPPLAWLAVISGGHMRAWCRRRVVFVPPSPTLESAGITSIKV